MASGPSVRVAFGFAVIRGGTWARRGANDDLTNFTPGPRWATVGVFRVRQRQNRASTQTAALGESFGVLVLYRGGGLPCTPRVLADYGVFRRGSELRPEAALGETISCVSPAAVGPHCFGPKGMLHCVRATCVRAAAEANFTHPRAGPHFLKGPIPCIYFRQGGRLLLKALPNRP